MTYSDSLNEIFKSYLAAKDLIKGKFDRDVRDPDLLLNVARKLDILPFKERTLKITGSKGKGTVARLCGNALKAHGKTGLVVSPEEIDHLDRISIDGVNIPEDDFITCFKNLQPHLPNCAPPQYLSPYGLFLLIALIWFKKNQVDYVVIETGRGVQFDEGGQVPSHVGVVTSILFEHASYLGPTLHDIRTDKLSIAHSSTHFVSGVQKLSQRTLTAPHWMELCHATAIEALRAFMGQKIDVPFCDAASFGQKGNLYFEGMIAKESADLDFLNSIQGPLRFLVSLPDDKDFDGVCDLLKQTQGHIEHIILTGERGFLSYEKARKEQVTYKGAYDDPDGLKETLKLNPDETTYFIGTQTYLRLIKQAYFS